MNQEEIDQLVDDIRDGMLCAWDQYGWIQGDLGDDTHGYCMMGAWRKATDDDHDLYEIFSDCAEEVIEELFPGRPLSVIGFNDFKYASEEDVRLMAKHSFEKMKDKLMTLIQDTCDSQESNG